MIKSQKTLLDNGVRVITENHPDSSAVHVGFWLLTGSRDEKADLAGISHFLEHLVFKGTKTRSAYDIVYAMESVGGDLNAFTTKEYTCFHTLSLKEHLPLAVDILADISFSSNFPKDQVEIEKGVVLQEISMSKEEYSEYIYDVYFEKCFSKKSIGQPILGSEKSVSKMKTKDIKNYHKSRYHAENLVVTVVGPVEHEKIVKELEKKLKKIPKTGEIVKRRKPKPKIISEVIECPSEQVHALLAFETSSYKDKDRFESYFLSTLLGGGMTSKLYQSLREKKGCAYTAYSYLYTFVDTALSCIYFATDIKKLDAALDETYKIIDDLIKKGISRKDLELYKTQMKGNLLLGNDDLESRMTNLAHNEMVFGKQRTLEQVISEIEAVSRDSVHAYIEKYLSRDKIGRVLMGQIPEELHEKYKNY